MNSFYETKGLIFPYKDKKWGLISIYSDSHEEYINKDVLSVLSEIGCESYLSLQFWDITEGMYNSEDFMLTFPQAVLFKDEQADSIVSFIDSMHNKQEEVFLIAHCDAGVSRSGAVGQFVVDYCGLDYFDFKKNNNVHPNQYVLGKLREKSGYYRKMFKYD